MQQEWGHMKRKRETLNLEEEWEINLTEKLWLSSVWQCSGGKGSHLGQTGQLSCACKLLSFVCPEKKTERSLECAWTSTCRTTTGGYVFEMTLPKYRLFSLSCSFLYRSFIPSETQASGVCVWLLCPLFPILLSALIHHSWFNVED